MAYLIHTPQKQKEVLARISEAECPVDEWWGHAEKYPIEATQTLLFGVLLLEDPARWLALWEGSTERPMLIARYGALLSAEGQEAVMLRTIKRIWTLYHNNFVEPEQLWLRQILFWRQQPQWRTLSQIQEAQASAADRLCRRHAYLVHRAMLANGILECLDDAKSAAYLLYDTLRHQGEQDEVLIQWRDIRDTLLAERAK